MKVIRVQSAMPGNRTLGRQLALATAGALATLVLGAGCGVYGEPIRASANGNRAAAAKATDVRAAPPAELDPANSAAEECPEEESK